MGRYAISLKHHEMRKNDNAMLGHPDMFWFDTRGVTHGDTWSSGTRSCQWGDSAGTPRHMLPWNYKSKHQFGTFLITTKKLKMYFFSYLVPKWPKCNYSTIIQLCFLFYFDLFVRKIPKYNGLLGLDLFQFHRLGCLGTSPIKSAVI